MDDMIPPEQLNNIRESAAVYEPDGSIRGEPRIKAEQQTSFIHQDTFERSVTALPESPSVQVVNRQIRLQNPANLGIKDIVTPNGAELWAKTLNELQMGNRRTI